MRIEVIYTKGAWYVVDVREAGVAPLRAFERNDHRARLWGRSSLGDAKSFAKRLANAHNLYPVPPSWPEEVEGASIAAWSSGDPARVHE